MKKIMLAIILVAFYVNSNAQSWSLTGNAGTNPPTNFIGTTDGKILMFKVNNTQSGYIDFAPAKANIGFGFQSLKSNTGAGNTAFGFKASFSNTSGKNNTASGAYALYFNTTGNSNIGIGIGALYKNINQNNLVAIGDSALYNNNAGGTSGGYNVAIGSKALYTNETGNSNTAAGFRSLYSNLSGSGNTASGIYTLYFNSQGNYNTAFGNNSLLSNTTGAYNSALGANALYYNQTGNYNTAVGYTSLYHNTSSYMTAFGYGSLYTNTTGTFNTAVGTYSMYNNSTGYGNAAFGYSALYGNTIGYHNSAFGSQSLLYNTIGEENTAIGYQALNFNTTASRNVAVGSGALYSQSFSDNNFDYPTDNVAIGCGALYSNQPNSSYQSGSENTALGNDALYYNIHGVSNTAAGLAALISSTGNYNTAFGAGAGFNIHEGDNNTFIGSDAGSFFMTELNNAIAIGYNAEVEYDNHVVIGNSSINSIGGQVGWTSFSDERIKTDVKENVPGLQFIKLLKPVTYHFSLAKENELLGKKKDSVEWKTKHDIEKINFTGLLAQQVDKAAKQINYDFSGVDKAGKIWGLRYSEFTMPLIKAVQELSQQNDSLRSALKDIQTEMDELKAMIVSNQPSSNAQQTANISSASLQQNIPNPFSNSTTIKYTLPQQYSSAKIIITDKNGNTLKQINLFSKGNGSEQIDVSSLASGAYQYALIIDGRLISSRQMIKN